MLLLPLSSVKTFFLSLSNFLFYRGLPLFQPAYPHFVDSFSTVISCLCVSAGLFPKRLAAFLTRCSSRGNPVLSHRFRFAASLRPVKLVDSNHLFHFVNTQFLIFSLGIPQIRG